MALLLTSNKVRDNFRHLKIEMWPQDNEDDCDVVTFQFIRMFLVLFYAGFDFFIDLMLRYLYTMLMNLWPNYSYSMYNPKNYINNECEFDVWFSFKSKCKPYNGTVSHYSQLILIFALNISFMSYTDKYSHQILVYSP